jgi:hypothetical protein
MSRHHGRRHQFRREVGSRGSRILAKSGRHVICGVLHKLIHARGESL